MAFGMLCMLANLFVGAAIGALTAIRPAKRTGKSWLYGIGAATGFFATILANVLLMGMMWFVAVPSNGGGSSIMKPTVIITLTIAMPLVLAWLASKFMLAMITRGMPDKDSGIEASYERETATDEPTG